MTDIEKLEEEIIILKEAVANISRENKNLHEWTRRALNVKSAITHRNIRRLTEIKRLARWVYEWMKNEDLEELYACKSKFKELKEALDEINLY